MVIGYINQIQRNVKIVHLKIDVHKVKIIKKIITRHVWEKYKEYTNELRYTKLWKELYPKRKETIERVFGDCKELHCLRYTRFRGLKKNSHNATMIFACHNLKKMARWMWKSGLRRPLNTINFSKLFQIVKYFIKKASSFYFELTLSTVLKETINSLPYFFYLYLCDNTCFLAKNPVVVFTNNG